ncbi:MAG: protein kinase [Myxococcales bacterium]|nr:protein kinase [Myxococcales bacterium]
MIAPPPTRLTPRIDRYQLLRVLGRGGMGVVYLAADTLLDREIALKVVDDEMLGDRHERMAALFQQEARNLAGLNHPGIVQVFDYSGLYSTRLYLVMEYVPGHNLGELLLATGPFAPALVAHVGLGVASVLAYAHGHGIVHQDLKPENILVVADGRLKLTDFGISRRIAAESAKGQQVRLEVAGTPAYMAPEQALGVPVDVRVDIFSLGATLYTLATGAMLVDAETPNDTVAAIARGDFPAVRERVPDFPAPLAAVIDRALAIEPDRRYADAPEMAQALAEAIGAPVPMLDDVPRVPPELVPTPPTPPPGEADVPPTAIADTAADAVKASLKATVPKRPAALPDTLVAGPGRLAPTNGSAVDFGEEHDGTRLLGRFELLRKLGSGALGEMWLAADAQHHDDNVAIKIFRPAPGASIDEFKAEFRELATLRHPNLVAIRDFGLVETGPASPPTDPVRPADPINGAVAFYTVDFVAGPDIRRAAEGAPFEDVLELLVQVARALIFLHGKTKRPHLSLKPENLLVTKASDGRPRVVLTDPGNPTEKLRSLHRGERSGLPYAAPETLGGLGAGPAADLYAFGVVAFELLAGRRPFLERTPETLSYAHMHTTPPSLRQVRPDLPEPIADVVAELLRKEPSRRPAGAEAWIRAVNEVVVPPYPLETDATRVARFSSAPWVGRAAVLERVTDALRAAMVPGGNARRLVLVTGERGSGKGRLLDELKRAAQLGGAVVFEGRAASHTGRSLGPLVPILAARYRGRQQDPSLTAEHRRVLRQLLGRARPGKRPPPDDATIDPTLVAELLLRGVNRPTAFLLRGADRMDRATIEVVARLVRALTPLGELTDADRAPPVFIALSLSEDELDADAREVLFGLPRAERVHVGPLDLEGLRDMLVACFSTEPLGDAQLETLLQVTGGVPSDVQDVLYSLIETGDLAWDDGAWQLRPGADVPLPKSAEEAVHVRLAALTAKERDVLEALAVFPAPVPANFLDSLGEGAPEAVKSLVERELLARRLIDDESCLVFGHERVRAVLLRELSADGRASRHRAAAMWLEAHRPTELIVEALASHWNAGGRPDRALSFLIEAAERAQAAGDLARSQEWYGEALDVLPRAGLGIVRRLATEARIRHLLGDACRAMGDVPAAVEHFERLLEIGRDLEDASWIGTARDRLAVAMIEAGRFDEAVRHGELALELASGTGDKRGQALAHRLLGTARRALGGPGAGLAELERALAVAGDDPALTDVRARVAVAVSYAHTDAGRPADGVRWAEWGLAIARGQDLFELEVSLLINLSMAAFVGGWPERALTASREAMHLAENKGLRRYHILALGNVGDTLRVLGVFDDAAQHLRAALRETYNLGATDRVVSRLLELSALALDRGRPRDALPYLREAWRVASPGRVFDARASEARALVAATELRLRLWAGGDEAIRGTAEPTADLLRDLLVQARSGPPGALLYRALALEATALRLAEPASAQTAALEAAELAGGLHAPELVRHADVGLALVDALEALGLHERADALRTVVGGALARCAADITSDELRESFRAIPAHAALLVAAHTGDEAPR